MNGLAWALYLGEAIGALHEVSGAAAVISATGSVVLLVIWALVMSEGGTDKPLPFKACALTVGLFTLLHVVTPSARTIYMMAGVQATSIAVSSDEGQEIMGLVLERIKSELRPEDKAED